MVNVYTTQDRVTDEVADDIKSDVLDKVATWISDESRVIDATLPNYVTPFKDIAADPGTPAMVEKACRMLVCDRLIRKLGLVRTDENGRVVDSFRDEGRRILRELRDGSAVIPEEQL